MKKKYINPTIEVVHYEAESVICGSGKASAALQSDYGDGSPDVAETSGYRNSLWQ